MFKTDLQPNVAKLLKEIERKHNKLAKVQQISVFF